MTNCSKPNLRSNLSLVALHTLSQGHVLFSSFALPNAAQLQSIEWMSMQCIICILLPKVAIRLAQIALFDAKAQQRRAKLLAYLLRHKNHAFGISLDAIKLAFKVLLFQ